MRGGRVCKVVGGPMDGQERTIPPFETGVTVVRPLHPLNVHPVAEPPSDILPTQEGEYRLRSVRGMGYALFWQGWKP